MNINFAPVDNAYLKDLVQAGFYTNITEAVRDAVRKMREQDKQIKKFRRVQALVREGFESIENGQGEEFTPELMDQIMQDALKAAHKGKPIPDYITGEGTWSDS